MDFNINYWSVIVVWLIFVGVGSFWYSPAGFGKIWSKLSGVDIMKLPKKEANQAILFVAISSLLQAYALAVVINSLDVTTFLSGLIAGFFITLGLTALTTIGTTFYARRGWKFWLLNAGFFLVVMPVASGIYAIWA